ncbi:MAG: transketolase [Gammaproteobacteria bacterium]|nr:transketolase [Gammaproteobacteria bacterium]
MLTRQQLANAVRALSMDAVQHANSGHPGAPLGLADVAQVLWQDFLRHNPANPNWMNRDRFVLSNGHASMLLYSLLHLTGYPLSVEDLKQFRQLHAKTPGHPEWGVTPGVETTTGPLGQGLANAVGMAVAERTLAATFNRPGFNVIDHHTYVVVGDGCLMEGLSHEVSSLAGTLGLNKLIVLWDNNGISIDGEVKAWFTEDVPERFRAYQWHVIDKVNGHDPDAIHEAIQQAKNQTHRPTLICCKTEIAFGAPNKANTSEAHGSPLGAAEIELVRQRLGWSYPPFEIPEAIYAAWSAKEKGAIAEQVWQTLFENYAAAYPELAQELQRRKEKKLPVQWAQKIKEMIRHTQDKAESVASRKASQTVLNQIGPLLPELLGGAADLTPSVLTTWSGSRAISSAEPGGNYLYYGVREFGMSAMMNGIALYGGFIPYGGTFLTFVDYARNAVRMAALMRQRVIFVYTHDSIGLGEDGPTHQPVEHAAMLRLTPGLSLWRPCDAVETVVAWRAAIEQMSAPTCLLLSRQNLPAQKRDEAQVDAIARGAYILFETAATQAPSLILIATGSEVALAMAAAQVLQAQNKTVRVVSMPCVDVFCQQSQAYQEQILPQAVTRRVAIEAGATGGWYQFVGRQGRVVGLDRFGESAPGEVAFKALGFTVEHVVEVALSLF